MTPNFIVTSAFLESIDACHPQRILFVYLHPEGLALNRENLVRAAEEGFDIDWFAEGFVEPDKYYDRVDKDGLMEIRVKWGGELCNHHENWLEINRQYAPLFIDVVWEAIKEELYLRERVERKSDI